LTIFNILSNVNRFRIFSSLVRRGQLTLSEIAKILNISESLVGKHLKKMELCGALRQAKEDQATYYLINVGNKSVATIITAFF